ncbi:12612_t:CDS:2 [Dentiscutata erythropus]|uniref:12612_t:CDS:1 n=1 Tax=Dentiscutata erythropus TaxID=1348616 RepID=A0A9N8YVP0_9GLOM|nr:12612_t:CDS:2 [Dentiscutata erythropus]
MLPLIDKTDQYYLLIQSKAFRVMYLAVTIGLRHCPELATIEL